MKWRTTPALIGSARSRPGAAGRLGPDAPRRGALLRSERGGSEERVKRRVEVLMTDERRSLNATPPPL